MTLWVRWCEVGPGPGMGGWVGEEEGECGTWLSGCYLYEYTLSCYLMLELQWFNVI